MRLRFFATAVEVSAHCDLPCGVYDPAQARIEAQSVKATIEKAQASDAPDFKVRDLSQAELGRKEIRLAEHEMPGLMALRARYKGKKPLAGARISGSLHMTVQELKRKTLPRKVGSPHMSTPPWSSDSVTTRKTSLYSTR